MLHRWSFFERNKPNLHSQDNDDDIGPIYNTARLELAYHGVERKSHNGKNQMTALVDSEALGMHFDDQLITELKRRHLDNVHLSR